MLFEELLRPAEERAKRPDKRAERMKAGARLLGAALGRIIRG